MISLPHLLTTARRFVDGVCALPQILDYTESTRVANRDKQEERQLEKLVMERSANKHHERDSNETRR